MYLSPDNAATSVKIEAVERDTEAIRPGDKAMLDVMKVWNGALPDTFQEAIDAGVEHGREEGSRSERLKFAERLLAEAGMPDAKVAKLADLPLREVQQLKKRVCNRGLQ